MVGKQFVSTTGNQLQAETAAGFAYVFSLTAKVGLQISFLGERNRGYKKHCRYQNPTHTSLRTARLFLSLALRFGALFCRCPGAFSPRLLRRRRKFNQSLPLGCATETFGVRVCFSYRFRDGTYIGGRFAFGPDRIDINFGTVAQRQPSFSLV